MVALEVARRLEKDQGISCEVIDVRSLRPLDRPTLIESVKKTSRCVVVEEDWYSYGVGAELVATIQEGAFDYLDAPIRRVAQAEVPLPYAKVMEQAALPKAHNLVETIKSHARRQRLSRARSAPLMAEVTMPRLSDTMEEGTIATWLKKPGEQVSKGDVLAQIETDKATMDLTAFEAGTLQEILAPEGTTVADRPARRAHRLGKAAAAPAKRSRPTASAPPAEPAATPSAERPRLMPSPRHANPRSEPPRPTPPSAEAVSVGGAGARLRTHCRPPARRPAPPAKPPTARCALRRWPATSPPSMASTSRASAAAGPRAASSARTSRRR